MQRQIKWRADPGARALKAISEIKASLIPLQDVDILDLHDIFTETPTNPMAEMVWAEMVRRNITDQD